MKTNMPYYIDPIKAAYKDPRISDSRKASSSEDNGFDEDKAKCREDKDR